MIYCGMARCLVTDTDSAVADALCEDGVDSVQLFLRFGRIKYLGGEFADMPHRRRRGYGQRWWFPSKCQAPAAS